MNEGLDKGKRVLIEGTQGFGLSVYHSGFYPHCTSRDTTAAGFLSEVGVSPRLVTEIIMVFRAFPIRVAGRQAGPMENEISWEQLRLESGYPHEIRETTSVTNKVRRVARFDWELAGRAISLNRPTRLGINGLDHLNYANCGVVDPDSLDTKAKSFVGRLVMQSGVALTYLGTGPRLSETFAAPADSFAVPEELCSRTASRAS